MTFLRSARRLGLMLVAAAAAEVPVGAAELNDYPTAARVDYVFAAGALVRDARMPTTDISDHRLVVATIDVPLQHTRINAQ